jgi:large subunit ribosomal protein L18
VCRRTNNHIYAQVVDDAKGHILVSASTIEKGGRQEYGGNRESATEVGKRIASRALEKGVEQVYFDRNGFKYHGRVAALAEGAREAGLSF